MKMKMKLALVPLIMILLSVASVAVVMAVPPNMDEGAPWIWTPGKGNARFVELQNKDYSWNVLAPDGRWGWIVYGAEMTDGNFDGSLEVKGLEPNSWFMVTLYSGDPGTGALLGSVGYYGKVAKPNWADIALFQTDAEGNAEIDLPYTSPAIDPVWGTLTAPTLPAGSYTGVTVAVKFVGTGDTPDWGLVMSGGYATPNPGNDYNIYEMAQLSFTIS